MSENRYAAMFETKNAAAWQYWRFLAIKDSRNSSNEDCPDTRCRWLDGKVFAKNDEAARQFLPPVHPGCRCMVQEVGGRLLERRGWTVSIGTDIPFPPIPNGGGEVRER